MADPVPSYFVDQSGQTVEVPAEQVQSALEAGLRPASDNEAMEFERQVAINREHGGIGGQLATGAAATGRALTLGLSDVALTGTGLVEEQTLKDMREVNPTADMVGTGVGILAPALLTGGASAAATGVKGAAQTAAKFTAPSLISRAGLATEKAIAAALPEATGFGAQVAKNVAGKAVGSAVEGAFYSTGNVISEAALGDPNLTAQSAAAEIGLGALLGGAFGGAFGAAEVAVPAAVSKAKDAIGGGFKRVFGAAEEGLKSAEGFTGTNREVTELLLEQRMTLEKLEKAAPGISERVASAKDPGVAKLLLDDALNVAELEAAFPAMAKSLPQQSKETVERVLTQWRDVMKDPQVRAKVAGKAADALQDTIQSVETAAMQAHREIIPLERAKLVRQRLGLADSALEQEAQRLAGTLDGAIKTMRGNRDKFEQSAASALEDIRDGFRKRIAGGTPEEIVEHILETRRLLDSEINYGKATALAGRAEKHAGDVLSGLRKEFKASIVNEDLLGPAGARQAALDKAQTEYRRALDTLLGKNTSGMDAKEAKLATYVGGRGGKIEVLPKRVGTWLKSMADPRGSIKTQAVRNYMEKARTYLDEIEASHATAQVGNFDRKGLASLMERTEQTVADTEKKAAITQIVGDLENQGVKRSLAQGLTMDASLAAKAVESILPGGVTSVAKTTIETVKSVPRAVRTLAALERMAQRTSEAIDRGTSMVVRGSVRAGYVGRGEVSAGLAREFSAGPAKAQKLFAKRTEEIALLADNPDALHSRLTDQQAGLEDAPDTATAVGALTVRGVNFLAEKIPSHPPRGPLGAKWVHSQAEIAKFNRYYEAVDNPLVILKQAAAGTLTPEAVEAVRAVYPDTYNQILEGVMDKVAEHGRDLPYRTRLMLSLLSGTDLDGTTSPESIRANQASFPGPSVSPQQNAGSPQAKGADRLTLSSRSLTPTQEAAGRR